MPTQYHSEVTNAVCQLYVLQLSTRSFQMSKQWCILPYCLAGVIPHCWNYCSITWLSRNRIIQPTTHGWPNFPECQQSDYFLHILFELAWLMSLCCSILLMRTWELCSNSLRMFDEFPFYFKRFKIVISLIAPSAANVPHDYLTIRGWKAVQDAFYR